jgi:hypothetical protein
MSDDRATALLIASTLKTDRGLRGRLESRIVRDEQEPIDYQFGTDQ